MEDEGASEEENSYSKRDQTNDLTLKERDYVFSKRFGAGGSKPGSIAL